MTFNFYFDAAHGWLEVPMHAADWVQLFEGDFSAYSYRQGDMLYLEEDLDAMIFVRAWEAEHGTILTRAIDHGSYSEIRNYAGVRSRLAEDEIAF